MSACSLLKAKRREYYTLLRWLFSEEVALEQVLGNGTYVRQQMKERGENIVEEILVCLEAQICKSVNSRDNTL